MFCSNEFMLCDYLRKEQTIGIVSSKCSVGSSRNGKNRPAEGSVGLFQGVLGSESAVCKISGFFWVERLRKPTSAAAEKPVVSTGLEQIRNRKLQNNAIIAYCRKKVNSDSDAAENRYTRIGSPEGGGKGNTNTIWRERKSICHPVRRRFLAKQGK